MKTTEEPREARCSLLSAPRERKEREVWGARVFGKVDLLLCLLSVAPGRGQDAEKSLSFSKRTRCQCDC